MDKPIHPWIVEKEEVAFKHPFMEVRLQRLRLPDGRLIPDWPLVSLRDYINVVAVDKGGKFLIIEGYKHGIGRSSWQILGGYIEEDEAPLTAAKRELLEEAGLASDEWHDLGSYIVDANRRGGRANFFLATNCREVALPDSGDLEAYTIHWRSKDELIAALADGKIEGLSYAAPLALALLHLP